MKQVTFTFTDCRGCPYMEYKWGNTTEKEGVSFKQKIYLCSLVRMQEIENEDTIAEWCPLEDKKGK